MAEALFVAVEGIDNSGKTTLTAGLADGLRARGLHVGLHKEPSDGPIGTFFRRLGRHACPAPMVLALLSAADRHQQQASLRRTREQVDVIVADRYYLSGLAYHFADGIDLVFYQSINRGALKPTAYLYLEVAPMIAATRRGGLSSDDYWEQDRLAARLPDAYAACLALVEQTEPGSSVFRLDAGRPAEQVLEAALAAVTDLVGAPRHTLREKGAQR